MNRHTFKIWDKRLLRLSNPLSLGSDTTIIHWESGEMCPISWLFGKEDRVVFIQRTGIADSDGKDVYDGDILSFHPFFKSNDGDNGPKIGLVEWSWYDASFRINQYHNGEASWDFHTFSELKEVNKFHIKGNINQNPELLL